MSSIIPQPSIDIGVLAEANRNARLHSIIHLRQSRLILTRWVFFGTAWMAILKTFAFVRSCTIVISCSSVQSKVLLRLIGWVMSVSTAHFSQLLDEIFDRTLEMLLWVQCSRLRSSRDPAPCIVHGDRLRLARWLELYTLHGLSDLL